MNAANIYAAIFSPRHSLLPDLQQAGSRLRLRDLGPAVTLLLIGVAALLVATLSPTGKNGQYVVIAPSWYRLGDTIALIQKVDGGIVDMSGPANIVVAYSKDPDFVRKAYAVGAWLVIDPLRLRGCSSVGREAS